MAKIITNTALFFAHGGDIASAFADIEDRAKTLTLVAKHVGDFIVVTNSDLLLFDELYTWVIQQSTHEGKRIYGAMRVSYSYEPERLTEESAEREAVCRMIEAAYQVIAESSTFGQQHGTLH